LSPRALRGANQNPVFGLTVYFRGHLAKASGVTMSIRIPLPSIEEVNSYPLDQSTFVEFHRGLEGVLEIYEHLPPLESAIKASAVVFAGNFPAGDRYDIFKAVYVRCLALFLIAPNLPGDLLGQNPLAYWFDDLPVNVVRAAAVANVISIMPKNRPIPLFSVLDLTRIAKAL
jgi:hypothetical protein